MTKRDIWTSLVALFSTVTIFGFSILDFTTSLRPVVVEEVFYQQPKLEPGKWPFSIRSIDTQVISKHWPDVPRESIVAQVTMLKQLGANYIAIGTPYDRDDELRMWAEEIHSAGLNVWFRSHWAEWEGEEGMPAILTPGEYLERTRAFILNNPDLFREGDAFTVAVEAEQVGIGIGKRFLTWNDYRDFLLLEIKVASEAFEEIGLGGKVHTNWLSMNGWIVDNQLTPELVEKMGLIVVDHFPEQSKTIGEEDDIDFLVDQMIVDLDRYYEQWQVPIMLGEWGYQIFQEVPDEKQHEFVEKLLSRLKEKEYLVGVNYWVHMGNSAALIEDIEGSELTFRQAAYTLKSFYAPTE